MKLPQRQCKIHVYCQQIWKHFNFKKMYFFLRSFFYWCFIFFLAYCILTVQWNWTNIKIGRLQSHRYFRKPWFLVFWSLLTHQPYLIDMDKITFRKLCKHLLIYRQDFCYTFFLTYFFILAVTNTCTWLFFNNIWCICRYICQLNLSTFNR